jgi:hypothetical protein
VRFTVAGPIRDVIACHCGVCRSIHGGAALYSACPATALTIDADGALRWYEHNTASYGFCSACGSSLFWRRPGNDTVSFSAGALGTPTTITTERHIYVGSCGDYEEIATGLPRHVEGSDSSLL